MNNEEDGPDFRIGAVQARQSSVGMESMDQVVLGDILKIQGLVVKSDPKFVTGTVQGGLQSGVRSSCHQFIRRGTLVQVRAWKLFMMLPRLLLSRPPRCGQVPKLQDSFVIPFSSGEWAQLVETSLELSKFEAQFATRRRRREHKDELSRRADRALRSVQLGELSVGRQELEGARLALGTKETIQVLGDPEKGPPFPRERLSEAVREVRPERFELDEKLFLQYVRSSRRGGAGGPSGVTAIICNPFWRVVVMQWFSPRLRQRWRKGRFHRKHWRDLVWVGSQH